MGLLLGMIEGTAPAAEFSPEAMKRIEEFQNTVRDQARFIHAALPVEAAAHQGSARQQPQANKPAPGRET